MKKAACTILLATMAIVLLTMATRPAAIADTRTTGIGQRDSLTDPTRNRHRPKEALKDLIDGIHAASLRPTRLPSPSSGDGHGKSPSRTVRPALPLFHTLLTHSTAQAIREIHLWSLPRCYYIIALRHILC